VFDAHHSSAAILGESGTILYVNEAWRSLAGKRGLAFQDHGVGETYLAVCPSVLGEGVPETETVLAGLRRGMAGEQAEVCAWSWHTRARGAGLWCV
jgi:hypothetical protein